MHRSYSVWCSWHLALASPTVESCPQCFSSCKPPLSAELNPLAPLPLHAFSVPPPHNPIPFLPNPARASSTVCEDSVFSVLPHHPTPLPPNPLCNLTPLPPNPPLRRNPILSVIQHLHHPILPFTKLFSSPIIHMCCPLRLKTPQFLPEIELLLTIKLLLPAILLVIQVL